MDVVVVWVVVMVVVVVVVWGIPVATAEESTRNESTTMDTNPRQSSYKIPVPLANIPAGQASVG